MEKLDNTSVKVIREKSPSSPDLAVSGEAGDDNDFIISESDFPPEFPVNQMKFIHEEIRKNSWFVPVSPQEQLETVLLACIKLAKNGTLINLFEI